MKKIILISIISLIVVILVILLIKTNKIENSIQENKIENVPGSYIACGCGCCIEDSDIEEKCLYKSKGDDILLIIDEDQKIANSPFCETAGCSLGVRYSYCE